MSLGTVSNPSLKVVRSTATPSPVSSVEYLMVLCPPTGTVGVDASFSPRPAARRKELGVEARPSAMPKAAIAATAAPAGGAAAELTRAPPP